MRVWRPELLEGARRNVKPLIVVWQKDAFLTKVARLVMMPDDHPYNDVAAIPSCRTDQFAI